MALTWKVLGSLSPFTSGAHPVFCRPWSFMSRQDRRWGRHGELAEKRDSNFCLLVEIYFQACQSIYCPKEQTPPVKPASHTGLEPPCNCADTHSVTWSTAWSALESFLQRAFLGQNIRFSSVANKKPRHCSFSFAFFYCF